MEMKVFSEKLGFFPELNRWLGAGDDAQPFVGERVISVADGMGGSGAQRVKSLSPAMTNPQTAFETAMAGCLPEAGREACRAQFDENFAQLYELGIENYLKSGGRHGSYFGSRFASVLLRAALETEFFGEDGSSRLIGLADMAEAERESWLSDLEERLAKSTRAGLLRALKNGALDAGTSNVYTEDALLGTTYSGVVYLEAEDCVHAVAVQAGDSLPFALLVRPDGEGQERLVLHPLMQAQESESGGITNFVGPNSDFYLRCAYFRLDKPCAIMTASDGAFDFFPTPIHFEHSLMYMLMLSNSPEDCAQRLTQRYFEVTTNDDSSTVAFKAFGFESFAQLQILANRRQIELNDAFALEDDALYSQDQGPQYKLNSARASMMKRMEQFKDELWEASPSLRAGAKALAEENNRTRMEQIQREADEAVARSRLEMDGSLKPFQEAVKRDWLYIRGALGLPDLIKLPRARLRSLIDSGEYRVSKELAKRDECRARLREAATAHQTALLAWCDKAREMGAALAGAGEDTLDRAEDYLKANNREVKRYDEAIDELCHWMNKLDDAEELVERIAEELLEREGEEIDRRVVEWMNKPEALLALTQLDEAKLGELRQLAETAAQAFARTRETDGQADARMLEFTRQVYEARLMPLINQCMSRHREELGEALNARIEAAIAPDRAAVAEARELIKRREALLARYDEQTKDIISARR